VVFAGAAAGAGAVTGAAVLQGWQLLAQVLHLRQALQVFHDKPRTWRPQLLHWLHVLHELVGQARPHDRHANRGAGLAQVLHALQGSALTHDAQQLIGCALTHELQVLHCERLMAAWQVAQGCWQGAGAQVAQGAGRGAAQGSGLGVTLQVLQALHCEQALCVGRIRCQSGVQLLLQPQAGC
jgi:hypothetical protein